MELAWKSYTAYGEEERVGDTALAMVANHLKSRGCRQLAVTASVEIPSGEYKMLSIRVEKRLRDLCGQKQIPCHGVERRVNPLLKSPGVTVTGAGEVCPQTAAGREKETQDRKDIWEKRESEKCIPYSQGEEEIYCVGLPALSAALQLKRQEKKILEQRFSSAFLEEMERWKEEQFLKDRCFLQGNGITGWYQTEEGGIFAALWKMAESKCCGFEVELKQIPLLQEVIEICEHFRLNPYLMQSAGCMIVTSGKDLEQELGEQEVFVKRIGRLKEGKEKLLKNGEEIRCLDRPAPDEWLKWLGGERE